MGKNCQKSYNWETWKRRQFLWASQATSVSAEGLVPVSPARSHYQAEAGLTDSKSDALGRGQGGQAFGPIL